MNPKMVSSGQVSTRVWRRGKLAMTLDPSCEPIFHRAVAVEKSVKALRKLTRPGRRLQRVAQRHFLKGEEQVGARLNPNRVGHDGRELTLL